MPHDVRPFEPGALLAWRLRRGLARDTAFANAAGALVVALVLVFFFFDRREVRELVHLDLGLLAFLAYLVLADLAARRWSAGRSRALWRWLGEERPAQPGERDLALRHPLRETLARAAGWGGAALVLGAIEALEHSPHRGLDVAMTVVLGGLTTGMLTYLLADRRMRPAVARALADAPPERPLTAGVRTRLVVVWLLASAVPVLGLVLMGLVALTQGEYGRAQLAAAAVGLGTLGLAAGLLATVLASGALGHSLSALRDALRRVREGDLAVRVPVDDGSEVGLLQAGFNDMARGLQERERMRELFGRHVGEEVARTALEGPARLGGEVREVAALFVDLEGSTALAASRPPEEVVALLNRFFAVVVEVVGRHGGWVNKFEGDAALCVFGAPDERPGFAAEALAAARELAGRLAEEVPELRAGIGASAGPAVAGNVGAEARYEYTVIGDPVNEAARLCELAKRRGGVLASGRLLALAGEPAAAGWRTLGEEVLRGRGAPTTLAAPAAGPS